MFLAQRFRNPAFITQTLLSDLSIAMHMRKGNSFTKINPIQALNADWLNAVAYQTIHQGYDKTFLFTVLITLVTRL
jgi:hypothetical protein